MAIHSDAERLVSVARLAMASSLITVGCADNGDAQVGQLPSRLDSGVLEAAACDEPADSFIPGVLSGLYLLVGMEARPDRPNGWQLVLPPDNTDLNTAMLRRLDYFPSDPVVGCNDGLFQRTAVSVPGDVADATELTLWWTVDAVGHLAIHECPNGNPWFDATYVAAFGSSPNPPEPVRVLAVRIGDAPSCEAWTGAERLRTR